MPVKLRSYDLETATQRLKLTPRRAPYRVRVAPGVALGYRRTADSFGTWSAIVADGKGGEQLKRFGHADDREAANGATILSFDQAMSQARMPCAIVSASLCATESRSGVTVATGRACFPSARRRGVMPRPRVSTTPTPACAHS